MKKFITICFVFLFTFSFHSYSEGITFLPERIITDFNGVVSNVNSTLCYGDYGIITLTQNGGKTWQQVNIGDNYNISKIKSYNKGFIGITENSFIKSTDNGLSWTKYEGLTNMSKMKSLAINNNYIFILHEQGIIITDHSFKLQSIKPVELDTALQLNEIETAGNYIYVTAKDKKIIRYNYITLKLDTISLNDNSLCEYCSDVSGLRIYENSIYCVLFSSDKSYPYSVVIKSTDNGDNWTKAGSIKNSKCYNVLDNSVYFISKNMYYIKGASNSATIPTFYKFDNAGKVVQVSDSTNDIKRNIPFNNYSSDKDNFNFKEIIQINKDTLVAVGINKLIAISYNNGINWEIKSFFDASTFGSLIYTPYVVNKNIIYVLDGLNIFKTLDGGITWLPQKYSLDFVLNIGNPYYYNFSDNGEGLILYSIDSKTANKLVTHDFGDSYTFTGENNPPYYSTIPKGLKLDNEFLYKFGGTDKENKNVVNYYTILKFFGSDHQLKDTLRIDSTNFHNIVMSENSKLYNLSMSYSGLTKTDTSAFFKNRNYILMQSTNNGRKWENIPVEVPFKEEIINVPGYGDLNIDIIGTIYYWKPYIIMPVSFKDKKTIYTFNTETSKFDSLQFPSMMSSSQEKFFSFKNELYAISAENTLYHTKSLSSQPIVWDSIPINTYLNNWKNYIPNSEAVNKDIIVSNWNDDNQAYLFTGKSFMSNGFSLSFKLNFVKLVKESPTSVEENLVQNKDNKTINIYPNPATNYLDIQPSEGLQPSEGSDIQIFDMLGIPVSAIHPMTGSHRMNIENLAPGMYFIKIGNRVEKFVKI